MVWGEYDPNYWDNHNDINCRFEDSDPRFPRWTREEQQRIARQLKEDEKSRKRVIRLNKKVVNKTKIPLSASVGVRKITSYFKNKFPS